ncbi:DUF6493 family protein [Streptomyces sp. NPDC058872]|uniref:DUF6493 family protein n=1 Tax=Streptomyces sp. NPDC058872 TaxID=3346661 RepID=UPI0036A7E5E2
METLGGEGHDGRGDGPVEELLAAVRAGERRAVPALLESLDAAARRAALVRLEALRSEVRAGRGVPHPDLTDGIRSALCVAGAGCAPTAAAAANWLGARGLPFREEDGPPVLAALGDRDPAWAAELMERLAGRRAVAENGYALLRGLAVRCGRAVPPTDGYVAGWTRHLTDDRLAERLREDPQAPALVERALAMAEPPERLARPVGRRPAEHWPSALRELVAEGALDRARVLDAGVSRLLRGGPLRHLRFSLEVVRLLEPDADELRARIPDWTDIAADAPSPVAGYAQEALAGLASAGALPAGALAEMTAGVLLRTEKKLLRAQLALVEEALVRAPEAADEVLPAVAEAFGHEDTGVQERALRLVGRHLSTVDVEVRQQLAEAAGLLGPTHRRAAEALFGRGLGAGVVFPYEEILPPVPEPLLLAPPAATVEEWVAELVVQGFPEDPVAWERALDGLVRHAHRDREAVAGAVREALPRPPWPPEAPSSARHHRGFPVVLAGLLGALDRDLVARHRAKGPGPEACLHRALSGTFDARLWEAADLIGTGALPFLLATPTWHTGAIDPLALVEGVRGYREAGIEPAPCDFAQALIRVRRTDPSAGRAAEEAEALGTPAGRRLAAWLRTGGAGPGAAPVGATVRLLPEEQDGSSGRRWLTDRIVVDLGDRPALREEFPPAFRWLGGVPEAAPRHCGHGAGTPTPWASALPADRELLAACLLPFLANCVDRDARGASEPLTGLAEAAGPVGRAVHLALAFGLGCVDADDRLRAVDAVLVLASRGELDARRLGTELGTLLADGSVKSNRLADAVRTASSAGAYGTVWAVLAALLPEPLGKPGAVRGLGEVLAVGADCAERCGARDEVAGLDVLAAGGGSSQLVVQATRLLNALRQGGNQSPPQKV